MDLPSPSDSAEELERAAVDRALEAFVSLAPRAEHASAARDALLPVLRELQSTVGWISQAALEYAARQLAIDVSEARQVAASYPLLSLQRSAPCALRLCDDVSCRLRGSLAIKQRLIEQCGPEADPRGAVRWSRSSCLGLCDRAPAALLTVAGEPGERRQAALSLRSPEEAASIVRGLLQPSEHGSSMVRQPREPLRLLRRVGVVAPASWDDYLASGGYSALRRAHALGAQWTVNELSEARLRERDRQGASVGAKWSVVAATHAAEKYVLCNGHESEPGSFKDRVLMEGDPFALIEAMTLAGFAVGATRGCVYVRAEHPLVGERLQAAIEVARRNGALGCDVLGGGQPFDIEVWRGAGGYICAEPTAMIESIEGRPPVPWLTGVSWEREGLFRRPTLLHNVETFVAALSVISRGASAFAAEGTSASAGTRLFSVSGHVANPGVFELPMGLPLRELLALAGTDLARVQAVLLGGAAGTFLRSDEVDLPLTFEDTERVRATLGSGAVIVIDHSVSMMDVLRWLAWFFRHENCRQCEPCREGTVRLDELVQRVRNGVPLGTWEDERERLRALGVLLRGVSMCGLAQRASSAIESAFERFELWPDRRRSARARADAG